MSLIITLLIVGVISRLIYEMYQFPPIPKPSQDIIASAKMREILHKMTGMQIMLTALVISMLIFRLIGI